MKNIILIAILLSTSTLSFADRFNDRFVDRVNNSLAKDRDSILTLQMQQELQEKQIKQLEDQLEEIKQLKIQLQQIKYQQELLDSKIRTFQLFGVWPH